MDAGPHSDRLPLLDYIIVATTTPRSYESNLLLSDSPTLRQLQITRRHLRYSDASLTSFCTRKQRSPSCLRGLSRALNHKKGECTSHGSHQPLLTCEGGQIMGPAFSRLNYRQYSGYHNQEYICFATSSTSSTPSTAAPFSS